MNPVQFRWLTWLKTLCVGFLDTFQWRWQWDWCWISYWLNFVNCIFISRLFILYFHRLIFGFVRSANWKCDTMMIINWVKLLCCLHSLTLWCNHDLSTELNFQNPYCFTYHYSLLKFEVLPYWNKILSSQSCFGAATCVLFAL